MGSACASLGGLFGLRESLEASVQDGFHNAVTGEGGVGDDLGADEQDQANDSGDFHSKGCDVAIFYPIGKLLGPSQAL